MIRLESKVALVTGGSSGIGLSTARALAAYGAKVAVLGNVKDEVSGAVLGLRDEGHEVIGCVADISEPEDMASAVQQVSDHWGRLDIVFANAGVNGVWAPLSQLSLEEWQKTLTVNLTGTFVTLKACLPLLRVRGGSVVITSSVMGTRMFSCSGATAYAASKAGLVAFAKMTALELARDKIRVNVVCPGSIDTPLVGKTELRDLHKVRIPVEFPEGTIPLKQGVKGTGEEVADVVLFLASDLSRHVTGTELYIDGAESLLQG